MLLIAKCKLRKKEVIAMKLIEILLIIIVFFIGIGFLIHICSKNKYELKYCSQKRKIEIYPADKSHQSHR